MMCHQEKPAALTLLPMKFSWPAVYEDFPEHILRHLQLALAEQC